MNLKFYKENGRKYCYIDGSKILMEGNIFDKVKEVCQVYFTNFKFKSNDNLENPFVYIHVSRDCQNNVEAFNAAMKSFKGHIRYDVVFR